MGENNKKIKVFAVFQTKNKPFGTLFQTKNKPFGTLFVSNIKKKYNIIIIWIRKN